MVDSRHKSLDNDSRSVVQQSAIYGVESNLSDYC